MSDDDTRSLADDRRRLMGELEVERNQLLRNIEWCRIRDIDRPFVGEWSLKDIAGHIATHEAEVVLALSDVRAGRKAAYFDIDDLDRWNADRVDRKRQLNFWSVLEQLRAGRVRLLEELALVSDDDLAAETSPVRDLVESVIEHDRAHWHDIAARVAGMEGARPTGGHWNPAA
ncbi:MAG: DinB family protein, partial [Hyphomicrobiales bacterium]